MSSGAREPFSPSGAPRYVAAIYKPGTGWKLTAESTTREPVDYAVAAMIQTAQSRGEAPVAEVWGPSGDGSDWQRLEAIAAPPGSMREPAFTAQKQATVSAREERLRERRHSLLEVALARALSTGLEDDDARAVGQLAAEVDEETVRRVAHWLSMANK